MRYLFGALVLYTVGYLGGNVLFAAIWIGIGYGFIDLMREGRM
tara:strand:- start:259 stop:387 length:129 start_codon:yes stop_codon:yes gene_type:complete